MIRVTSVYTAVQYEALGWKVIAIVGHNRGELRKALTEANNATERSILKLLEKP